MFKNLLLNRFAKNFTWLFLFNNLGYLFSLVSIPILISKYGLNEMGIIFTLQSIVISLAIISNYSLTFYIPTLSKKIKKEEGFLINTWNLIVNIRLYLSLFFVLISILYTWIFQSNYFIYWLFSLSLLLPKIINPSLIYNALENNKPLFFISFFSKLLFLICIIITNSSYLINFFLGITEFVVILFFLPKINSRLTSIKFISFIKIKTFFKDTNKLFLVNIFSILKPASILPCISYFLGNEYVTLYTLADKIINYIRNISGATFVSYYPIFNEKKENIKLINSKSILLIIFISIWSILSLYIISPYIIYFLNNSEFNKMATKTLQILSFSIPSFFIIIPLFSHSLKTG